MSSVCFYFQAHQPEWQGFENQRKFMVPFSERLNVEVKIDQCPQWEIQRVIRGYPVERNGFIRLDRNQNSVMRN